MEKQHFCHSPDMGEISGFIEGFAKGKFKENSLFNAEAARKYENGCVAGFNYLINRYMENSEEFWKPIEDTSDEPILRLRDEVVNELCEVVNPFGGLTSSMYAALRHRMIRVHMIGYDEYVHECRMAHNFDSESREAFHEAREKMTAQLAERWTSEKEEKLAKTREWAAQEEERRRNQFLDSVDSQWV